MKPSQKCKAAGLTGLAELVEISGMKYRTLLYWAKNAPDKFDFVVRAAGAEKAKGIVRPVEVVTILEEIREWTADQ